MTDSSTPNQANPLEGIEELKELSGKAYVSLHQAASIIGVSYQTMLRYIKPQDGNPEPAIRAVKVGGSHRIYEEELRRFLTEGNRK